MKSTLSKKRINKIHNTRRSQSSNHITTFLDNHSSKFIQCAKFTTKSKSVNFFYSYFLSAYQKYKRIPKVLKEETELPVDSELDVYLDNIASGDLFRSKDEFKSKIIMILKLLAVKYKSLLDDILEIFPFTEEEKKTVLDFINKLVKSKLEEEEIIEWFNFKGQKLARSIYIFILQGKFPQEINNILGMNPEIYGEFTSLDIQKDIELNLSYGNNYKYQCGNINLNLKIYTYVESSRVKSNLLDRIFFLHYLHNSTDINLTLWLSNKKKELNYDRLDRYIGPKEINSGCTTFMGSERKVSVWRKEELDKVLIHELFHSLDLEDRMNTLDLENFIYQYFDIRRETNKLTIFEYYVEIMANIMNVFFLVQETFNYSIQKSKKLNSSLSSLKKKNHIGSKKSRIGIEKKQMFRDILWIEKCWVMFQAAKILHYYRYEKFEDFYHSNGFTEEEKTNKYLQKSNVFSYIILRSLTFYRLNRFLELCKKYNGDYPMQYQIPNEVAIKFWKEVLEKSGYVKTINKLIKLMREIEKKKNTKEVIFKSMRMTCVEAK